MASIAEFIAAGNALNGVSGSVGTLGIIRIPYVTAVSTVLDGATTPTAITVAGSPTYTASGGPDYTAGSGGGPYVTFNGTTQGLDLGNVGADTDAIDGSGFYFMMWIRHTSTAAKQRIMGSYSAIFRNGYDICMNQNNLDGTSANFLTISQFDNAGANSRSEWDLNAQDKVLNQAAWVCVEGYISSAAAPLAWYNGVQRTTTSTNGALPAGAYTSAAQKTVIGGYGFGGSTTYDSPMDFRAGILMSGKPSDAQRLTLFKAMEYTVLGIPSVRYDMQAVNAKASGVTPSDVGVIDTVTNANLDYESLVQATAARKPVYMVAANYGVPVISANNRYQSAAFGADTIRQALAATSIRGMNSSAMTIIGALHLPYSQILGNTNQTIMDVLAGGSVKAALNINGVSNGIARLKWYDGSTQFDAASLLDAFSGPGLVVFGATMARTGASSTITLAMQNVSATATGTVAWNGTVIDSVRMFGDPTTNGNLGNMWMYRSILADSFVDSATLLSAMSQLFDLYKSPGETMTPQYHTTIFHDSIGNGQFAQNSMGYVMQFPRIARANCSWRNISIDGFKLADLPTITPNAANKKGGASVTTNMAMIPLCLNDYLANNAITAATMNTNLGLALAAIPGYNKFAAVGIPTPATPSSPPPTLQTSYQALMNARVSATLNASIGLRDLTGKMNTDNIHPLQAGHLQMAQDIWYGTAGTGVGSLSGLVPDWSADGGTRSRNYRSRNYR